MIVRPLKAGDKQALQAFACSDGQPYADETQGWINRKLFGWWQSTSSHEARVLVDDNGALVGVCAFDPADHDEWFVWVVAIRFDLHGQKLGGSLFQTCLDELETRTPDGSAFWRVDKNNVASHKMSLNVGAEVQPSPAGSRYDIYYVSF